LKVTRRRNRINAAVNIGVFANKTDSSARPYKTGTKKTIIVTGIARSGTSMIASMLQEAGLFIGEFLYDVVNEDAQILEFLRSGNKELLKTLIAQRNGQHVQWGFKIPNLHAYLRHDDLSLFRNPHLIVISRDPVAVAMRDSISEHLGELQAMVGASSALHSLAQFVQRVDCPVLLVSYEKALSFPNVIIDSVLKFCGITPEEGIRNRLFVHVQPNRAEYLTAATRRFLGRIDGILDGQLYGWCCQEGRLEPVRLDLLADGRLLETFHADSFREDLAAGGVGNGCHGFFLDLKRHRLKVATVIRVKVTDRVLELENSGHRLDRYMTTSTTLAIG